VQRDTRQRHLGPFDRARASEGRVQFSGIDEQRNLA
jgi:hypothetical protein